MKILMGYNRSGHPSCIQHLDLPLSIHDLIFVTFVIKVFGSDTEFTTALHADAFIASLNLPLSQKYEKQDTAGNHAMSM